MQKQAGIRALALTVLLGIGGIAHAGQALYTVNCAPNGIAYWVFSSSVRGALHLTSGLAVDDNGKPLSCKEAERMAREADEQNRRTQN
jgi:hypothetical protein